MAEPNTPGQGYSDPVTGQNPFMALGGSILRALGVYAYAQFMPTPDLPIYHSVSSARIFSENKYIQYQTAFKDATLARRTEALSRAAERIGLDPALVRENSSLFSMLLRADTPEMRAKIRKDMGPMGDLLLRVFDSATANETNLDRVYSGLADTYGTERGNEMATYAANYAANLFQNVRPDGLRNYSASSFSATLQELQKTGYNFQVAAGVNGADTPSYAAAYEDAFNSSTDAVKTAAWNAQMEALLTIAPKEEQEALKAIQEAGLNGGEFTADSAGDLVGEGKSFKTLEELNDRQKWLKETTAQYAQLNTAQVQRQIIQQNLDKGDNNNVYIKAYNKYLTDNKINIPELADDATDEQKAEHAKKVQSAQERFASAVISNKKDFEDLYADNTDLGAFETAMAASQQGEAYQRANAEVLRLAEETHRRQAVGRTVWDQLSQEEQQQYLDAYSDVGGAQAALGSEMLNKYFHEDMRRFQYETAAYGAQRLFAAAAHANLSEKQVSQQAAFIGSTIQHKGLIGAATTAAIEWQAAAKSQGVMLSDEDRAAAAQRSARIMDSVEGGNIAMFMTQTFDESTPLGKKLSELQKAVKAGNMTPEQESQFRQYMQNSGTLLADVSKATGKTRGELVEEARWVEDNWNAMSTGDRTNTVNAMHQQVILDKNSKIFTEASTRHNVKDSDMQKYGVGKDSTIETAEQFRNMIREVVTSSTGMDPRAMVSGLATDADIKRMKEGGHAEAAKYALERRALREQEIADKKDSYMKQGLSEEEAKERAIADVNSSMGATEITRSMNAMYNSREDADTFLRSHVVDTTAVPGGAESNESQEFGSQTDSTSNRVTRSAAENASGGERKPESEKDSVDMMEEVLGKDLTGAKTYVDGILQTILDWVKSFIGGNGPSSTPAGQQPSENQPSENPQQQPAPSSPAPQGDDLATLVKTPAFQTAFGKAVGEALKTWIDTQVTNA